MDLTLRVPRIAGAKVARDEEEEEEQEEALAASRGTINE